MTITTFVKPAIFIAGLLSMAAIFSRCTGASSGSGSAATTFSISGNMSIGQTATSLSVQSTGVGQEAILAGDVNALATQCNDGYYYTVYCVSYSEPPVAATGAVTCSGNSGAFTVAGLPLNAEIGCFVRRSADNTSYATLGTIEIPTTSLSGGTTTLVSQGNLSLAIDLNTDGSITTTVTGGGDNVVTPVDSGADVDVTQYNGFWSIQCDSTATGELVDPVRCKCQNGGQQQPEYQNGQPKGSMNPEQSCIADNAAEVSDAETQQFVEINMYKATPGSNLTIDNGAIIPAGTQIPVISVWSASTGSSSMRKGGGEGALSSVKDKNNNPVALTWNIPQATDPIALANASDGSVVMGGGVTTNFAAVSAMPSLSSSTHAQWIAYVTSMYNNSTGFTCNWGSGVGDAGCLSEFTNEVLREHIPVNLPRIRIDRLCDNLGCDTNPTHARVEIDGLRADYSGSTGHSDNSAITFTQEGVSPDLRNRYVFEPFEASPTGGGFTQHEYYNRNFSCTSAGSGADVVNKPACNGSNQNWVNCGIREETAIKFKPSSATAMKLFFEQRASVVYATLEKWNGGTKSMGTFAEAMAICEAEKAATESRFQMTAAKQP